MYQRPDEQRKNPKRVEAGRRNHAKRNGLTEAGRRRLREAAYRNKPWRFSTGPRSSEGKAKVAMNGKKHQTDDLSVRQLRSKLSDVRGEVAKLAALRRRIQNDGN